MDVTALIAALKTDTSALPAVIICHPTRWQVLTGMASLPGARSAMSGVLLEVDSECPPDQMIVVPADQLKTYERGRRWADPVRCAEVAAQIAQVCR